MAAVQRAVAKLEAERKAQRDSTIDSGTSTGKRREKPVRVGGDLSQSRLVKKIEADCPEQVDKEKLYETVLLHVMVDKEGLVKDVKIIRGRSVLAEAAEQAVRQWQFSQTFLYEEALPTTATVRFNFVPKSEGCMTQSELER